MSVNRNVTVPLGRSLRIGLGEDVLDRLVEREAAPPGTAPFERLVLRVGENWRRQLLSQAGPAAERRTRLLGLDGTPECPRSFTVTAVGGNAREPGQREHHPPPVAEPVRVLERLHEPVLCILSATELERAVHHRAQRPCAPPAEPGLTGKLRASGDQRETLFPIALRVECLARKRQSLRLAPAVAVRTMELEAFGGELARLVQIAAVERRVAEAEEKRRHASRVVELAKESEARAVCLLGEVVLSGRVARAPENAVRMRAKLDRE